MERTLACILLLSIVLLPSCKKDEDDPPAQTPVPTCGIAGARLQASFLSESFCPDLSLFADRAVVLTINGVSASGSTLTLELDSLDPGSYDMTEDANHVLFTNLTGAYESSDTSPATLVIASHDEGSNRIQGSFSGPLTNPLGGTPPTISGSFDMIYLE
ncbi:MAG TPA: hypothetical protein PLB89_00830 [Flavobacteriales bacterium]|nr:hypothetical protein [Flavobacteriales bacterium]